METLDKFDLRILEELQSDGRLTNAELAQRVGLSAAPCWRRVRALEDAGYVPNATPSFDPETVAVYVGAATNDYVHNLRDQMDVYRHVPSADSHAPLWKFADSTATYNS